MDVAYMGGGGIVNKDSVDRDKVEADCVNGCNIAGDGVAGYVLAGGEITTCSGGTRRRWRRKH